MLSQTLVYRLQSSSLCLQDPRICPCSAESNDFLLSEERGVGQPAIGKPLKCAIYPSEAKRLFHYFDVRNSWPLGWTLTAISHYPTTFLFAMVLFEPLPKFGAIPKVEKINYFHGTIPIRLY